MQMRLNESPLLEEGYKLPDYASPVRFGRHTVNTGEQSSQEDADLPAAEEELLEISSR